MRRVLLIVLALGALLTIAATPALGQEPHRFSLRQNGVSADAFWQTCEADTPSPGLTTCQTVSIFAFEGRVIIRENGGPPQRQGGQVCISQDVVEGEFGPPISSEFGCTEDFLFDVTRGLSAATLSATVPVESFVCTETPDGFFCEPSGDAARDVEVSAEWTSVGPLTRFRERSFSRTETDGLICVFKQSGRGLRTEAVATAMLDSTDMGESQFGTITKGRFRVLDRCRQR
jgi:hypothetical protein